MKKNLGLLALFVLAACLMDFAFDRILPAAPVAHAASDAHPVLSSAGPTGAPAVPLPLSAQPVAFVVTGLVCVLFGILAVAPLLLNDLPR
jgi:hypothetical protein